MREWRANAGFTLVETLVSLAIASVLGLVMASAIKFLNQSSAYNEHSQVIDALSAQIRLRLIYKNLCSSSIAAAGNINQGQIDVQKLLAGQQQIGMHIPNMLAGEKDNTDVLVAGTPIHSKSLVIDSLTLTNVLNISPNEYIGVLQMGVTSAEGFHFKIRNVGAVDFILDPSHTSIDHCVGLSQEIYASSCTDMGCEFDDAKNICNCAQLRDLCNTGEFPTGYSGGLPNCEKIGAPCPPGQFIMSVGLGTSSCAAPPP